MKIKVRKFEKKPYKEYVEIELTEKKQIKYTKRIIAIPVGSTQRQKTITTA